MNSGLPGHRLPIVCLLRCSARFQAARSGDAINAARVTVVAEAKRDCAVAISRLSFVTGKRRRGRGRGAKEGATITARLRGRNGAMTAKTRAVRRGSWFGTVYGLSGRVVAAIRAPETNRQSGFLPGHRDAQHVGPERDPQQSRHRCLLCESIWISNVLDLRGFPTPRRRNARNVIFAGGRSETISTEDCTDADEPRSNPDDARRKPHSSA
jgi:hypothetical protein